MGREQGPELPLSRAYELAARAALASPADLRRIVEVLAADGLEDGIDAFVPHPDMPEDVLLDLCEQGLCVSELGHRPLPRHVLRRVVELHAYPEAMLSRSGGVPRAAPGARGARLGGTPRGVPRGAPGLLMATEIRRSLTLAS